jgi:hypothetical protein
MTKELGVALLVSSAFARHFQGPLTHLGAHALKGVGEMHALFAPA